MNEKESRRPAPNGLLLYVGVSIIIPILMLYPLLFRSPQKEEFTEEKLFEEQTHSYLVVIKASGPNALEEGIKSKGSNWQVVGRYQVEDPKYIWKFQAHLVAAPSH